MSTVITDAYRAEQAALHAKGNYGTTGAKYGRLVHALLGTLGAGCVLDYGCGSRRSLLETLDLPPDIVYEGYDPAVPEFAAAPAPADLVCCIDVLEHIEPDLLPNVLRQLGELADPYGFFTVHTGPAQKVLSDGRNAHLIQQGRDWWLPRLSEYMVVAATFDMPNGFAVLVHSNDVDRIEAARTEAAVKLLRGAFGGSSARSTSTRTEVATTAMARYKGVSLRFHTPNEATAWRVNTLASKEPDTMRWLEAMPAEAVLFDVGANVGMYSIVAGVGNGCRVYAFEPESQNYALLNANIELNGASERIVAFPVALSDAMRVDRLFLCEFAVGGSCHSFGAEVDHNLEKRRSPFVQGCVSLSIDQLVQSGAAPVPDYIKIDVDGFEHKVLEGARETLANRKVKGLLVELNTHLAEHQGAIRLLQDLGFQYDPRQAEGALRTGGIFEGVGEFIFTRLAPPAASLTQRSTLFLPRTSGARSVLHHVLQRVAQSEVASAPFPHTIVDDVLPADYYAEALRQFPAKDAMRPLSETGRVGGGGYKERLTTLFTEEDFARLTPAQAGFWREFADWLYCDAFLNAFVDKFQPVLEARIAKVQSLEGPLKVRGDALLVNDQTHYAIGPHTDAPHRLVTFLLYMPSDTSQRDLGTSLYAPRQEGFTCWGGPHHPHDQFRHVQRVEFLPNRLFAFPKTERSFHGVEPITRPDVDRHLLINNIRLLNQVTH